LFKLPKYRSFNYPPRYYDPEHEELMERVRKAEQERDGVVDKDAEYRQADLRQRFREARRDSLAISQGRKLKYRMRILVILGILCLITYLILGDNPFWWAPFSQPIFNGFFIHYLSEPNWKERTVR